MTIIDQMLGSANKNEDKKELERYRSMDSHSMSFSYKGYSFLYRELSNKKPTICIKKRIYPQTDYTMHVAIVDVNPFNRRSFETWCICWTVDNAGKKEQAS